MILLEGEKDVWLHTETRSHKAIGLYLQAGYCKKKPRWTQRGEPLRLHILGGAGSGKSYVARQISKCFAIPHYDLDDLFWDKKANEYGIKASESERDVALQAIVSQNDWVIEGVYMCWAD